VSAELKECTKTAKRWSQEAAAVRKVHVDEQKEFLAVVKSAVGALAVPATVSAASATVTEGVAKEGDSEAMDVCEVKKIKNLLLFFACRLSLYYFFLFLIYVHIHFRIFGIFG